MAMIRVMIADDHPQMRRTLSMLLERDNGVEIVGAVTCVSVAEEARRLIPDVIVLDIRAPRLESLRIARQIEADGNKARVLFISMSYEPSLIERIQSAGGLGFVHKEALIEQLLPAIRAVNGGECYFR